MFVIYLDDNIAIAPLLEFSNPVVTNNNEDDLRRSSVCTTSKQQFLLLIRVDILM